MADEASSKPPWYIDAIKSLGIPTCFLVAILVMLWEAGTWAGSTVIYPLYEKQSKFIDDVSSVIDRMESSMEAVNKTLEAHGSHAVETLKVCNESKETTVGNSAKLDLLHERFQNSNEKIIGVLEKIEKNTGPIRDLRPVDMQ